MSEPYHFFLSIPVTHVLETVMGKSRLEHHLLETSKWKGGPHITIVGFNTYDEPSVVRAAISNELLLHRVAPINLTLNGCRRHESDNMQVLLLDKNDEKELRRLRRKLSCIVEPHVVHRGTFRKYLNHLCPIFHIAVGKTMSPANLETLASSLRGISFDVDSLELEIRKGLDVLETATVFIGMRKECEPSYRLVYQT